MLKLFIKTYEINVWNFQLLLPQHLSVEMRYTLGPGYWNVPKLMNTGTFLVYQYCPKMHNLHSLWGDYTPNQQWACFVRYLKTGPRQQNFVDARSFSSTCFRPSGAAQQQLGFWNFTSRSVWKWRLQWRNSGSPIERYVAHGTLISAPRYASAWKQRKRR